MFFALLVSRRNSERYTKLKHSIIVFGKRVLLRHYKTLIPYVYMDTARCASIQTVMCGGRHHCTANTASNNLMHKEQGLLGKILKACRPAGQKQTEMH